MLRPMVLRILLGFAATLGALTPGHARGEDVLGELVTQVMKLREEHQHGSAARLAAAGAARVDLAAVDRVMLGGLARESFERSFEAGGKLGDLCGLAAVMRLVAPLDVDAGGRQELAAAVEAEARLEQIAGPGWRAVCEGVAPVPASAIEVIQRPVPLPIEGPRAVDAAALAVPRAGARIPRRVRAGIGTLVPGLVMFAPMAAVLAYRAAGERELRALRDAREGRLPTAMEEALATDLQGRYEATTVAAAFLGATGAALVVTGAVLLATPKRRSRMAVAPWGARRAGGLVLMGGF